jgi:alkaline phosphatase D
MRPELRDGNTEEAVGGDNVLLLERRRFIRQLCATSLLAAQCVTLASCRSTEIPPPHEQIPASFSHGVASGDPLMDRVILWTRITPHDSAETRKIKIRWEVASDDKMQDIVSSGDEMTGPDQDYTVKIDAVGLKPGRVYFYRFSSATSNSPIGRTKTLPGNGVEQIRLAVFSCANYPSGYFNVYADAAKLTDIDVALHIGDYIYEYESTGYDCAHAVEMGRISDPPNVLVVLSDYRRRYAQYRTDADLQTLHSRLPFISVWDDHEFADDAWRGGAADHTATLYGPFSKRKAAAIQAFHEWTPIRLPNQNDPQAIYRSFDFGKLVSLHMLDTRMVGRDQQLSLSSYYNEAGKFETEKFRRDVKSPTRKMLGTEQLGWLEAQVSRSKASWQILGQQVLMARMEYPIAVACGELKCADFVALKKRSERQPERLTLKQKRQLGAPTLPCYMDSWDGYQSDREKVFSIMCRHDKNLVVLAGDSHNAWASDLRDDLGRQVGVEFATSSVSSPGLECAYPGVAPAAVAEMMKQLIRTVYFAETSKRGYMIITATEREVRADWRFVDTVHKRKFTAATERSLRTIVGPENRRIVEIG